MPDSIPEEVARDSSPGEFHISSLLIAVILLACAALGLIRIGPTDTPWHLASARLSFETAGLLPHWLTSNTFSYTFPDFQLKQQYPLYQSIIYAVYRAFDFEGLSIFHCILWFCTFLLLLRLGGGLKTVASHPLPWLLILLGLQRRMILRPDILTLPLLLLILANWEQFDRGRISKLRFFVTATLLQWLLSNAHQMWTLGLLAMTLFFFDALYAGFRARRHSVNPAFLFLTLLSGVLVTCINPLGWRMLLVPASTIGSLSHHRSDVTEFAAFGENVYPSALVVLALLLYVYSLLRRTSPRRLYELALVLGGFILALLALRGTVFAVCLAGLFSIRSLSTGTRENGASEKSSETEGADKNPGEASTPLRKPGLLELSLAFSMPILLVYYSHFGQISSLQGVQYGIGKSRGQWPSSSLQFLRENPPEGEILNLSWYLGNSLIWELYPGKRVFVDPRFESYPRDFLKKAIRAEYDFETLRSLITGYQPEVILLELRLTHLHKHAKRLLESGEWTPVALDPQVLVLARSDSDADSYAARFGMSIDHLEASGFTMDDERIRRLEHQRIRGFYSRISANSGLVEQNHLKDSSTVPPLH